MWSSCSERLRKGRWVNGFPFVSSALAFGTDPVCYCHLYLYVSSFVLIFIQESGPKAELKSHSTRPHTRDPVSVTHLLTLVPQSPLPGLYLGLAEGPSFWGCPLGLSRVLRSRKTPGWCLQGRGKGRASLFLSFLPLCLLQSSWCTRLPFS